MINARLDCIIDCFAVGSELSLRFNEVGHLSLRQADGFPAMAFEECSLSLRFGFGFRSRLEKHSPLAERAKINDKLVFF